MWRLVWMLMLAGLFVALGCEQKSDDRTPGKVTSEDVRRDASKAVDTAVEYSKQTTEEFQRKLDARRADRMHGKVAPEEVRPLVDQADKTASDHSQRITEESQEIIEVRPVERVPADVMPKDVRRDTGPVAKPDSDYVKQTKMEFQNKLDAQLNAMDGEITKLREKGRNLKDSDKAKWDEKMAVVDTKMEEARATLENLDRASEDTWKDAREKAQRACDDLERTFREASR